MAEELQPLDVSDSPDLARLAEEVARTRVPRLLRRDGQELAIVQPVAPARSRRSRSRRTASPNAWIEGLIGIGESADPVDVSSNIHAHVAEAIHAEGRASDRE
jgi:hypothetical protein